MADTDATSDPLPSPAQLDIMNDDLPVTPASSHPGRRNTASTVSDQSSATCRICRSEGTPEEPLFHPCKCSGSIKHVHQECLMEWLSHSQKKHCELCKTPFRFTKLYDAAMPGQLPWSVFLRRGVVHVMWSFGRACRGILVGAVWLVILPWLVRWAWRWIFWVADAGWARKGFERELLQHSLVAQALTKVNETAYSVTGLAFGNNTRLNMDFNSDRADAGPEAYKFAKGLINSLLLKHNGTFEANSTHPAASSFGANESLEASVLSSWAYISQLTPSTRVNRILVDIFEGQLITCVVITGFILVFLIREWVVQQQPQDNLDNIDRVQQQLVEAAERVEADNERLRRQQELLEQARRRLVELQRESSEINDRGAGEAEERIDAESVEFGGWEALDTLIDHATAHLRNDGTTDGQDGDGGAQGQDERQRFKFCAQAVLRQIRAAGLKPEEHPMDQLAARIAAKLGTLSAEERSAWEGVLLGAVESARGQRLNRRGRRALLDSEFRAAEERREEAEGEGEDELEAEAETDGEADGGVKAEAEVEGWQHVHSDDIDGENVAVAGSSSNGNRRPRMPDRDFSSRATQIQRLLEEAEGIFNPAERDSARAAAEAYRRQGGEAEVRPAGQDEIAEERREQASQDHDELVQAGLPGVDDLPITNAGPDAKLNIRRSGEGKLRAVPEPREETSAETKKRKEEDEAMKRLEEEIKVEDAAATATATPAPSRGGEEHAEQAGTEGNSNPFHPDGTEPERRASDAATPILAAVLTDEEVEGLRQAEMGPDAEPAEEEQDDEDDQAPQRPPAPPSHFQRLADWFWGDIEVQTLPAPAPAPAEERVDDEAAGAGEQEAPFVPVVGGQPALPAANANANAEAAAVHHAHDHAREHEQHDPEVVAAAQAAGLDAEAIEDAEDLEGIFELIGWQGPLLGLFQTSTFCTVLVTGTVFGAVGLPYIWGKLVLSFIGSPMCFVLKLPLQFASSVADFIVDITLLLGGWAVFVAALASNFLLSAAAVWVPRLDNVKLAAWIADMAATTASKSGGRLQMFFLTTEPLEQEIAGWNWAFLGASVHAHASLREVQGEVSAVIEWLGQGVTDLVETISSGSTKVLWERTLDALTHVGQLPAKLPAGIEVLRQWTQTLLHSLNLLRTGSLSFDTPSIPIDDPSLIYWSTTDRALAVSAGYASLALLAAVYVALDTPLTHPDSPARKTETLVRDTLRQAGGVLKVILIISIEMLVFPFYCGVLLDLAFLPLFAGASVATRWQWAVHTPYVFCFVHWFVGTCYMFHFALFVGMCRKILRKGVLWFIRDPDDPTFHPVRDVLERNVLTQLRKIAFSALVYGALVILCLGGVIWTIGEVCHGIFPIHWVSTEPVLEFPMDLLLYNAVTPVAIRVLRPTEAVSVMYGWWLRRCARMLRLSHFLFDERKREEEGTVVRRSWASLLLLRRPVGDGKEGVGNGAKRVTEKGEMPEVYFQRDGKYVLTPCNDQYRPPKPGEAFLHADEEDVYIADKDGNKNDHFAKVYVPPAFRLRVTLFMVCLWIFSAFTGLCATLVPLVFGRHLFASFLPDSMRINDIYAYSAGAYILGGLLYVLLQARPAAQYLREKAPAFHVRAWTRSAKRCAIQALKCAYVYGFVCLVLPTVCAMLWHFYFILPLHTYVVSMDLFESAVSTAVNATNISGDANPFNHTLPTPQAQPPLPTATHTMHILQDYCLGLLYVRLATRYLIGSPSSRAAEAFRRITAAGYLNPDFRLATRFLVAPVTVLSTFVLLFPPVLAKFTISALAFQSKYAGLLDTAARTKIYRYSYPMTAGLLVLAVLVAEMGQATARWRARVRDEVYLVGERLHNFGEKRPPVGSRSVVRRER